MLLLVLELIRLSTCTSLPLLDWALSTMPTAIKVYKLLLKYKSYLPLTLFFL